MTIGIPRALIYWKRPQFWESFFENLGFKTLLSPKTNKEIVEWGVKASDPENCFSAKVFFGHLLWLDGKVDWIFVPRLKTNAEKLEYCPKFFALPDLSKMLIRTPILTETFNEKKESFEKTLRKLGKKIGKEKKEVEGAREKAFLKEKEEEKERRENFFREIEEKGTKIALVSHPYNFYDDYVNLTVKEKLKKLGAQTIFIEEVPINSPSPEYKVQNKDYPKFHWEFGKEWMEKIDAILGYKITGAIEISSFQCGCDAVLKEFVEKKFKQNRIPFLYLLIDEQTGEAGLQTRLEAFIDTLH
ncbi:MAG TPA: acyl-CoA dehydratase activase-related protein [Candidatus Humimicrobiaceae bacterium]|nr:acyl-CoA dehydratase activase-related protein [Candidatus Humimicrobiaceae bacterium]